MFVLLQMLSRFVSAMLQTSCRLWWPKSM